MRTRQRACRRLTRAAPNPDNAVANEPELSSQHSGMLSALDFWICAVEAVIQTAAGREGTYMEAVSKAQDELERIESQIEQLQAVAGDNQDAQKQ